MAGAKDDKPAINIPLENIREPGSHDVLSGRGVTTNRHPGNVSYRSLVALNKVGFVIPFLSDLVWRK